jgi:hypothetical protein
MHRLNQLGNMEVFWHAPSPLAMTFPGRDNRVMALDAHPCLLCPDSPQVQHHKTAVLDDPGDFFSFVNNHIFMLGLTFQGDLYKSNLSQKIVIALTSALSLDIPRLSRGEVT